MALYLGLDIGGTASRWAVVDAHGLLAARGSVAGATGLIFDAASLAAFTGVLEAVRDALPGPVAAAHLGITGAGFKPHREVEAQVSAVLGLPRARFGYSNDMVLAWHAAFRGAPGHLVSAGTGSIGVSIDATGTPTVVGGRGILVDDGGSGTWIALRTLDAVYRLIDEHGTPKGAEIVAARLFAAMGGDDRDALRAAIYGRDRGRIGLLAVPVAEAATDGDPLAGRIIAQAAEELVRLARALLARCGPAPLAFIGGVLTLHPAIRAGIEQGLAGHAVAFPTIDAALHAAHMAREAGKALP